MPLQAWKMPWEFQEVEGPRLLDIRQLKAGRLSASHTGRSKTVTRYHNNSIYRILHIINIVL
jgi:hypothetical protein